MGSRESQRAEAGAGAEAASSAAPKSRIERARAYIYDVLDELGDSDSRIFELFISTLIFLNVVAMILETVDSFYRPFELWFQLFERFSMGVFTLEYLLRMWACTANPKYTHPVWGRLRYFFLPLTLIDLLTVLPFWIPQIFLWTDLRQLRAVRLLRLFKFFRYSRTLNLFARVLWIKRHEMLITMSFMMLLLLISSSLMYHIEHTAQPDKFGSIPDSMWWGIATLTTVGYGDIFPITHLGRFMASIIAIMGIGMFALPTGILGAAFVEEMQNQHRQADEHTKEAYPFAYCPHCGKSLPEPVPEPEPKSAAEDSPFGI